MDYRNSEDDSNSDDEIFIGPITLKEIKKTFCRKKNRCTLGCAVTENNNEDSSFKLIQTHSAPNVRSNDYKLLSPTILQCDSSPDLSHEIMSDQDINPDDTFLKLEQMVSSLNVSLDNYSSLSQTSEAKSYFFNEEHQFGAVNDKGSLQQFESNDNNNVNKTQDKDFEDSPKFQLTTPIKSNEDIKLSEKTPVSNNKNFKTPSSVLTKTSLFKTPGNPASHKKTYLTPSKRYQNVVSPVATYINKCPVVPLVKDIRPKKQFSGVSSIPKLVKTAKPNASNKENIKLDSVKKKQDIVLPSVAYKSAKETKLIDIPDDEKLPESQWAKQVASSIPRAMVIKHSHRETTPAKKALLHRQEDSFADLSLHQADLSVCTSKSAFNKPKRIV